MPPALGPRTRRGLRESLLFCLYFLAAAASFNGFYTKWGFRDGVARYSLPAMLDGAAERPFVYRQLLPMAANALDAAIPEAARARLTAALLREPYENKLITVAGPRRGDADNPAYALRYHIIYYLDFLCLLAALFVMRWLARAAGAAEGSAVLASMVFALLLPVLISRGGYFYDLSELLLLFLGIAVALRARPLLLPLAAVATLNKESYLFFLVALAPLAIHSRRDWRGALVLGGSALASAITYLVLRSWFAANAGGAAEFHLWENLAFYANPFSLLSVERSYGLIMFAGYSVVMLALVAITVWLGWWSLRRELRWHAVLALAISAPLWLLFAYPGETRNLSLLFPTLLLLIAGSIQRLWPPRPTLQDG